MLQNAPEYNSVGGGFGFPGFGGGFGFGGGGILEGLLFGSLLSGRGGLFGRDGRGDCGCGVGGGLGAAALAAGLGGNPSFEAAILSKLGNLEAAVPLSTAAINAQTAASASSLKDTLQGQTLFQSQAFAGVKDSIQATYAGLSAQNCETQNMIQSTACDIKQTVRNDGDATRALINTIERENLLRQLEDERHDRRGRDTEINVTNNINQMQMQQQQQQQFNGLISSFHALLGQLQFQNQRATAGSVQFGTGNVAANTPTNTANQVGGF